MTAHQARRGRSGHDVIRRLAGLRVPWCRRLTFWPLGRVLRLCWRARDRRSVGCVS
jgi:hypothetical protein